MACGLEHQVQAATPSSTVSALPAYKVSCADQQEGEDAEDEGQQCVLAFNGFDKL